METTYRNGRRYMTRARQLKLPPCMLRPKTQVTRITRKTQVRYKQICIVKRNVHGDLLK